MQSTFFPPTKNLPTENEPTSAASKSEEDARINKFIALLSVANVDEIDSIIDSYRNGEEAPACIPTEEASACIPTEEAFEEKYAEYFNTLRFAAKDNQIDVIKRFKNALSGENFLKLLHGRNRGYSDCAIIHYAAEYNHPNVIESLVGHLTIEERLSIFLLKNPHSGCTTLHFIANVANTDHPNYNLKAGAKIKELLYREYSHRHWLKLLKTQQNTLDTACHYAARQENGVKLLDLLSTGLSSDEWKDILSIENKNDLTALHVYFLNMSKKKNGSHKKVIRAFRGPMTEDDWVEFLVSNKVVENLHSLKRSNSEVYQCCLEGLSRDLSYEQVDQLETIWSQLEEEERCTNDRSRVRI